MFFAKKTIGIEINPVGVYCAALSGSAAAPRLLRIAMAPFPTATLKISLRDPNILEIQQFIDTLKAAHNLLLTPVTRLNVTLPDTVGRVMLLDMEGRFKSRAEALDMIRWKLKKSLPFDLNDTHLDYQQIGNRENGDMALLIALVSKTVISQYEELILAAGFTPTEIDFNSFNLHRPFAPRLEQFDDVTMISFFDSILSIMVFFNGELQFQRVKDLSGSLGVDSRVFMEINSSLIVFRDRFPERQLHTVACIAPPDVAGQFCSMVEEAVNVEPVLLEIKSAITPANDAPADQVALFPYTTAIGAAMRSL